MAVDCDLQWDGQEVADEDIKSGSYLLMEYLAPIAGLSRRAAQESEDASAS